MGEVMTGASGGSVVVDDRGDSVRAIALGDLARAGDDADAARRSLARHLKDAVRAESRRRTPGRIAMVVVLVLVLLAVNGFVVARIRGAGVLPTLTFWGGIVVIIVLVRIVARRKVVRELSSTAVAEGFCGSCGYTLADLTTAADGCVQCPECGAAWKAARVTRPHWVHRGATRAWEPAWWRRFIFGVASARDRLSPDDRGRFVAVVDSRLRAVPPTRRAEIGAGEVQRLSGRLRGIGRLWRILVSFIPFGLAAWAAYGAVAVMHLGEAVGAWVLAVIALVLAGVGVLFVRGHGFYSLPRAARAMVEEGLCGSCAGSLVGLAADGDGFVVCPSCGGAWKGGSTWVGGAAGVGGKGTRAEADGQGASPRGGVADAIDQSGRPAEGEQGRAAAGGSEERGG
ncbi:MAG: hypothetical protein KF745_06455 [Phycisphaeraceae bacterium]|nr:hypothetical protein [Phycisphaeraceae bacterium]